MRNNYGLRVEVFTLGRCLTHMSTQDWSHLSAFGSRERRLGGLLPLAWSDENWASRDDHLRAGATLELNPDTGRVFLIDGDYNIVMQNQQGKLENWLYCCHCGAEGFRSEVAFADNDTCSSCVTKARVN